jgi:hypothetical protein
MWLYGIFIGVLALGVVLVLVFGLMRRGKR